MATEKVSTTDALDLLARACARDRKSKETEKSYRSWLRGFIRWVKQSGSPGATSEEKVSGYLDTLSSHSASSQKQALNALVFFYRAGLERPLGKLPPWTFAKRPRRLPTWLTREECFQLFRGMDGQTRLISELMFGSGLRLKEAINLRIQDLDFGGLGVKVRSGKGDKSRVTCLPKGLVDPLREQIERCREQWRQDLSNEIAPVPLPDGLERKFPAGGKEFEWFWLWPAPSLCRSADYPVRWHLHEDTLGKALKVARRRAGLGKRVTAHTLRHSFATVSLMDGMPIHELKELMGHASIKTTEVYLHCLPMVHIRSRSPFDIAPQTVIPFLDTGGEERLIRVV